MSKRNTTSIAIAALLIAVGNIVSRLLGLGRNTVIAYFFGRSLGVDAYIAALTIPVTIYDLLVNGAISAALVPVLSDYAEGDERSFWCIVSSIINIALLALALIILLVVWQAPLVVGMLVQHDTQPQLRPLTVQLVRVMLPAVLFMGISGILTAVLYARRTFLLPAFAVALFNAGIIVGAVLLHQQLGVMSLAIGMIIGAVAQVVLQLPGLRHAHYHVGWDISHPAVRRILRLYAPVALGIGFSIVGTMIDRWLASGFTFALSTMQYATTLIQFPLGLVAAAVSMAILPTLSRQEATAEHNAFRRTLAMGIKVVILLVFPATVGLATVTHPIVALLFQRGAFATTDTSATALALFVYLPGLPAAAIDQLLIFAFYARKNTLTPNLVQGVAVLLYVCTALPLLHFTQLGFLSLVVGNSLQWIGHMLLMVWLIRRHIPLKGLRIGEAVAKAVAACGVMALVIFGVTQLTTAWQSLWLQVAMAVGVGGMVYVAMNVLLRVESFGFFTDALVQKLSLRRS